MTKILIATRNKKKLAEIKFLLADIPFEILDFDSAGFSGEIEEGAATFEGNVVLKAVVAGERTGLLTLADDSGLEADALGGRPGVFSARYAPGDDAARRKKLLDEMENIPDEKRGAQFRCVIAIYDPARGKLRTAQGVCRGKILREERGGNGFGYDPVFWSEDLGKTMAEASPDEKNRVSHRGRAMREAKALLADEFSDRK